MIRLITEFWYKLELFFWKWKNRKKLRELKKRDPFIYK